MILRLIVLTKLDWYFDVAGGGGCVGRGCVVPHYHRVLLLFTEHRVDELSSRPAHVNAQLCGVVLVGRRDGHIEERPALDDQPAKRVRVKPPCPVSSAVVRSART